MLFRNHDKKLLAAIARYQRHRGRKGVLSRLICLRGKLGHTFWSVLGACDISRDARIDPSTRFPHLTGIVIHRDSVVKPGCLIMQQVTLGQTADGGVPIVEEGAYLGAGARVLGPVRIGSGARIGANAVVLQDVPPGATAVGVPARIVRQRVLPEGKTLTGKQADPEEQA